MQHVPCHRSMSLVCCFDTVSEHVTPKKDLIAWGRSFANRAGDGVYVGGVVSRNLLSIRQPLAVQHHHHTVLACLALDFVDGHVEVDGRHNAVAELLVEQDLEALAVVLHCFHEAIDGRLLHNVHVESSVGRLLHLLNHRRWQRGQDLLQLGRCTGGKGRLQKEQLSRKRIRIPQLVSDAIECQALPLLGIHERRDNVVLLVSVL
mmetsp:Transcript_38218/g.95710  ORF Transcript_38218/g.95710 Transcript_38218/m.95710 type:complete len:205 (+) Transcript_38218:669-1283(+)